MTGEPGKQRDEDPGWHLNWRVLPLAFPYGRFLFRRQWARGDSLINLRNIYLSFPLSLAFLVIVPLGVVPFHRGSSAYAWAIGIGVFAVVAQIAATRLVQRPMPCDSDETLAAGYRARMFLRVAFANTPALFGFTAAFVTESSWVFYAALLLAIPGLVRAAPTRAALVREQDALNASGCDRSLVAALRRTPLKLK